MQPVRVKPMPSLSIPTIATKAELDTTCTTDYIIIEGSSAVCSKTNVNLSSKYCGGKLSTDDINDMAVNVPICGTAS